MGTLGTITESFCNSETILKNKVINYLNAWEKFQEITQNGYE